LSGSAGRKRKLGTIAAVVLVAVVALVVVGLRRARTTADASLRSIVSKAKTIEVSTGDMIQTVSATGKLKPVRSRSLYFDVSGKITQVNVREGQAVKAGAVLAELDQVEQRLAYLRAKNEYDRAKYESPSGIVEEKLAALTVAEKNLAGTRITAPFSGIVSSVDLDVGDQVVAAKPVLTLIDTTEYIIDVNIDEVDVRKVSQGQTVAVSLDAYPDLKLTGVVDSVAVTANFQGDLVTIPVTVKIDGHDPRLRPGLTASLRIQSATFRDVVRIPVCSWVDIGGSSFVVLVTSEGPTLARIERGIADGAYAQIVSGLRPGDIIVEDAVSFQEQLKGVGDRNRIFNFGIRRAFP
jgi:multidrug efflux pump subunit AcrA (membrane-fusion protein)